MAHWKWIAFAAALPLAALAHTTGNAASGKPAATAIVFEEMHNHVVPQAQTIWDVTNAVLDNDGNPSAKLMKPGDWAKLRSSSAEVAASLERLAAAKRLVVSVKGQKLLDEDEEDGAKPSAVQANINRNPAGFRQYAKALAVYVRGMEAAASKRDLKKIYNAASELDGKCEGCHEAYWFAK